MPRRPVGSAYLVTPLIYGVQQLPPQIISISEVPKMSTVLCCPQAALDVVLLLATSPPRKETVCLLLDADHRGLGSVVVKDAPRDLMAFTATLSDVLSRLACIRAVVLATSCPGFGWQPSPGEHIAFLECRERLEPINVDLIDWFLLDDGHATSLAESTDARSLWRPAIGHLSVRSPTAFGPA